MIGTLLSGIVKVVTCPIDMLEAVGDVIDGGDGSKESREEWAEDIPALSKPRDAICEVLEDLDTL